MTLLRRHGLWLVVAALAGIAGAWLYGATQPRAYLSTAQVDVEPNPIVAGQVVPNMATEEQVATSGAVVDQAAATLGVTPASVTGHLSASVSSTSTVLSVGCTMSTPAAAQRCAQAAAVAYVNLRNQSTASKAQQARAPLHVTLVTPATLPKTSAGPGKRILLPIGALLGLVLGAGAIIIRDHFDDRVRDRADLERCLQAPVLAAIPRIQHRVMDPASVFSRRPQSNAAEAYRYLRSLLKPLIVPVSGSGRIVLVASPQGLEGRTCVAANLGMALAQMGASVLLVDADLRYPRASGRLRLHPTLSEIFHAGDRPGLSQVLTGTATLGEVEFPAEMPADAKIAPVAQLRLLAAGAPAGQTADLFDGVSLAAAFAAMRDAADVVVVDTGPVLAIYEALAMARASDVVVMVADVRRTGRGAVSAAVREIRASGPRNVVGVLNNTPPDGTAFVNGPVPDRIEYAGEWLASWGSAPEVPDRGMAPHGQNGRLPAHLGAMPGRSNGAAPAKPDTDDPVGSG